MRTKQFILTCLLLTVAAVTSSAQIDKREVRKGNRDYRKEDYKEAEIEYRKAIVKDSLSVAANYNLAADLYRQDNSKAAQEILAKVKEEAKNEAPKEVVKEREKPAQKVQPKREFKRPDAAKMQPSKGGMKSPGGRFGKPGGVDKESPAQSR